MKIYGDEEGWGGGFVGGGGGERNVMVKRGDGMKGWISL